jgi:hypothetical protein
MNKIIALVVVVGVAGAFLGLTQPGHRLLSTLGFATACTTQDCWARSASPQRNRAAAPAAERSGKGIMNKIIALAVVAVVAAGFLGFTSPGHRLLSTLGFATACPTPQCWSARERIMNKIIALAVVVVLAGAFLGFTSPGHRLLSTLGFATACVNPNCWAVSGSQKDAPESPLRKPAGSFAMSAGREGVGRRRASEIL